MVVISLILSVLIGVFAGSFFNNNESFTKKLLIVSAGFLIMICFQELFPSIYSYKNHDIGLYVILGVILQMFLENLTKGFEHGHIHHHEEEKQQILPIALMIGLFIHAFIEGIPLANDYRHGHGFLDSYLLGILVHNIPISFVLGAFLFNRKKKKLIPMIIVGLFSLSSPMGMFLGKYIDNSIHPYFLALVGGIFIHISSVIIFESNKNHKMDWQKIILVMFGISLAYFSHLEHHH